MRFLLASLTYVVIFINFYVSSLLTTCTHTARTTNRIDHRAHQQQSIWCLFRWAQHRCTYKPTTTCLKGEYSFMGTSIRWHHHTQKDAERLWVLFKMADIATRYIPHTLLHACTWIFCVSCTSDVLVCEDITSYIPVWISGSAIKSLLSSWSLKYDAGGQLLQPTTWLPKLPFRQLRQWNIPVQLKVAGDKTST